MSKGYDKPNYTQAPNVFFDQHLKEMGEAEYKVVACVIRHTFGYHRDRAPMSLSFFEATTGLTRQAVIDGINAARQRGVLGRSKTGNSYEYWLVVNEIDYPFEQGSPTLTSASQPNRPELVNQVDHFEHALKKEKENIKERGDSPDTDSDPTLQQFWQRACNDLRLQLGYEAYEKWVRPAQPLGYEHGVFTLAVPNSHAREWLEQRLKLPIARTLSYLAGQDVDVQFTVLEAT